MNTDVELPTIEEKLDESELEESDAQLTNFSDFAFTFVHIPDPPKVEVKRTHIIEAINQNELNSVLVSFGPDIETTTLFYITENSSEAYEGSFAQGVHTMVDILLCEDWFVLDANIETLPESVGQFFEEMQVLENGFAEEGELWSETFGRNQLKERIVSLKEADSDLFSPQTENES